MWQTLLADKVILLSIKAFRRSNRLRKKNRNVLEDGVKVPETCGSQRTPHVFKRTAGSAFTALVVKIRVFRTTRTIASQSRKLSRKKRVIEARQGQVTFKNRDCNVIGDECTRRIGLTAKDMCWVHFIAAFSFNFNVSDFNVRHKQLL